MQPPSTVCTPPATKRPGESLAAPAAAGQGACAIQRCLLRLASSAATRPGLIIFSCSFLRSALSLLLLAMLIQELCADADATGKRSAGAAAAGVQAIPVGNHGDNQKEATE
jgi:hypothetical protein